MMEVKGVIVKNIQTFIKETKGEEKFSEWLTALSPEAQDVYSSTVLPSQWQPLTKLLTEPLQVACQLFYDNDLKGAWELGRFDAEKSLTGIYKIFIRFGTPEFIISKGGDILPTYYRPSTLEVAEKSKNNVILRITEFPEMHQVVENVISGWIERAAELCDCKNVQVKTNKSLTRNDEYTEFHVSWEL